MLPLRVLRVRVAFSAPTTRVTGVCTPAVTLAAPVSPCTVAGGTLGNVNVAMNAVLCFIKNGLIDDPQHHTLSVLSVLLGIDFENGNEVSVVMLNDVGERLHRQGYAWTRAEAEGHFDKDQVSRLRQVAEHLGVLWQILNDSEEGEFKVRMKGSDEPRLLHARVRRSVRLIRLPRRRKTGETEQDGGNWTASPRAEPKDSKVKPIGGPRRGERRRVRTDIY